MHDDVTGALCALILLGSKGNTSEHHKYLLSLRGVVIRCMLDAFFSSFKKFVTLGLGLLTSFGNLFTADSDISVDVTEQPLSEQTNSEMKILRHMGEQ